MWEFADVVDRTRQSLIDRVEESGYAPTSLTGAYVGMFGRDASIHALALDAIGRRDLAISVLRQLSRFHDGRVPHVVPAPQTAARGEQPRVDPSSFLEISGGVKAIAEQAFRAHEEFDLANFEVQLSGATAGILIWDLRCLERDDMHAGRIDIHGGEHGARWQRLTERPILAPPGTYLLRIRSEGAPDDLRWLAARTADEDFLPVSARQFRLNLGGWIRTSVFATLRTGADVHVARAVTADRAGTAAVLHTAQPDADAMFALVVARLADGAAVDSTPMVEKAIDGLRSALDARDSDTGLIRNPNLEHSRFSHYLTTLDLVTNVFASQALHELAALPTSHGSWLRREADALADAVHSSLTFDTACGRAYAELFWEGERWRFIPGFSWVNLAPAGAAWFATDPAIMRNTFDAYRMSASSSWSSATLLNVQDHERSVIGKGLAWELMYTRAAGWNDRMHQIENFIATESRRGLFAESYSPSRALDPGNQEHAAWFVYATRDSEHKKIGER